MKNKFFIGNLVYPCQIDKGIYPAYPEEKKTLQLNRRTQSAIKTMG